MRLYAIGDVHGMDDLLAEAHVRIAADLALRPAVDHRIVHLGDYADRGPASAAVIERLARLATNDPRVVCLRGNHDAMLLGFLADPEGTGADFLANGGGATLRSYGVTGGSERDRAGLSRRLAAAMPPHHLAFLHSLRYCMRFGDFFFCHAGVRPGVPLDRQTPEDLTWIREEFLFDRRDFGTVIVHGHTPVREPDVRPNRIDIDTGAVFSGRLTTLGLEGTDYRFL
jgi:serine/threonine protein phosphatase 1